MRIVFFGTPELAEKSLKRLYASNKDVVAVFTQGDKPRNRGMKVSYTPVKETALLHNTPVYQPDTLKEEDVIDTLKELNCDVIVVVAYGKILPKEVLELPPLGCINIHTSILPKYRGAAPIQWAILNGEHETGVTSMYINEKMDEGDIIKIKTMPILPEDTSITLADKLGDLGAELLDETLTDIANGTTTRTPQDHSKATYAQKLSKEMSPIDWDKSAEHIINQIKGLQPWPVATMELSGKTLKVFSADILDNQTSDKPGTVISCGKHGIEIACADKNILIKEVQASGSKRMSAEDYLRGNPYTHP